jgi:hypothetical protein
VDGAFKELFISINHQEKVILGTGQPSPCYYSSSAVETNRPKIGQESNVIKHLHTAVYTSEADDRF